MLFQINKKIRKTLKIKQIIYKQYGNSYTYVLKRARSDNASINFEQITVHFCKNWLLCIFFHKFRHIFCSLRDSVQFLFQVDMITMIDSNCILFNAAQQIDCTTANLLKYSEMYASRCSCLNLKLKLQNGTFSDATPID